MGNQPLEPIKEGEVLNRPWTDYFTFMEGVAEGSYGLVYLVRSKIDNKVYIIK